MLIFTEQLGQLKISSEHFAVASWKGNMMFLLSSLQSSTMLEDQMCAGFACLVYTWMPELLRFFGP